MHIGRITMDLDVEKFISEIEKRPAIWNVKCQAYSDRIQKVKQWEDIINMFTDKSASVEHKRKLGLLLQKRWKTLRDAFVKENRQLLNPENGSAAPIKKQYKFYKQLLFLLPVISINTTRDVAIEEDTSDKPHEDDTNLIQPEPKKAKKSDATEEGSESPNSLRSEEDSDRQFMLSLVSDFKRVPPRLKSMVKINILKCIMDAQEEIYYEDQGSECLNNGYFSNDHESLLRRRSIQPSTSSYNEDQTSPISLKLEFE